MHLWPQKKTPGTTSALSPHAEIHISLPDRAREFANSFALAHRTFLSIVSSTPTKNHPNHAFHSSNERFCIRLDISACSTALQEIPKNLLRFPLDFPSIRV